MLRGLKIDVREAESRPLLFRFREGSEGVVVVVLALLLLSPSTSSSSTSPISDEKSSKRSSMKAVVSKDSINGILKNLS